MAESERSTRTLTEIFDRTRVVDDLCRLIAKAKYIDGGYEMGISGGYVFPHMQAGDRVVEWKVKREPPVLFLPLRYGQALLPLLDVPIVYTPLYSPGRKVLRSVRRGEIVIGFRRRGQLHHFMMSKALVERFLDPLKRREEALLLDIAALESYVAESGLGVRDILALLKKKMQEPKDLSL